MKTFGERASPFAFTAGPAPSAAERARTPWRWRVGRGQGASLILAAPIQNERFTSSPPRQSDEDVSTGADPALTRPGNDELPMVCRCRSRGDESRAVARGFHQLERPRPRRRRSRTGCRVEAGFGPGGRFPPCTAGQRCAHLG